MLQETVYNRMGRNLLGPVDASKACLSVPSFLYATLGVR